MLSDGQKCQSGIYEFSSSHTFDPMKNITKIVSVIENEAKIMQINFYHHQQRLVMVGESDAWVQEHGGRAEVFDIADGKQLIGCRLNQT